MAFILKKTEEKSFPPHFLLAVESLHADLCTPLLHSLQKELVAQGVETKVVLLPSEQSVAALRPILIQLKKQHPTQKVNAVLSILERALSLSGLMQNDGQEEVSQATLLNNGSLASMAFFASALEDSVDRIALYRFLDEFEHTDLALPRPDLTLYIDILPEHVTISDRPPVPAGFDPRQLPEFTLLRERFLEASKLLPKIKIVPGHQDGLLLPDVSIHNKSWELVRRVVLGKRLR